MAGCKVSLLLAIVLGLHAAPVLAATITPGADFNVDATVDTDGDNRWEDTVGTTGFDFQLAGSVTRNTGVSAMPGIGAAYDFVGGSTGNADGALLSNAGSGTRRSFQNASGDWTNNEDVTMEVWFKPGNLTPTPTNGQILFEDGGGTGFGFFVDNNELRLRKAPGGGNVAANIAGVSGEFIQAVGTYDASAGTMELFVNGASVGTASPGGNDWSGGDAAAVGTRGASNTGGIGSGQSSTESFDGQVAAFRVYRNQILTPTEVTANYEAVVGEYGAAVLADSPFGYWRLNEATGPTARNIGTVGAALDATYHNASGFALQQPSLLINGEGLSARGDGATGSGGTEIRIPDNAALNTGAHDNKTVELWFKANSITSTPAILYEQGGNTRGINLYVEEVGGVDTLFMGAWNLAESNWPVTFVSSPVDENRLYHAVFVLEGDPDGNDSTDDGFVHGYLNGFSIGSVGGAGSLRAHGDNAGVFGIDQNVRYADGSTQGDGGNFDGFLDDLALYNTALSRDQVVAHYEAAGGEVPEPATLALLSLAACGLGGYVRKRRKA